MGTSGIQETARAFLVFVTLSAGAAAPAQDLARGEQLFGLCRQCHGEAGEGSQLALAPAIAGLSDWYVNAQLASFRSGARGTHPDDVGGLRMHPMSLSLANDDDVQAVAAYVASLPPTRPQPVVEGGDAARGAMTYQQICVACHGLDGAGNQALGSPSLRFTSDWYLASSIEKFKTGVRTGSPQNPNGVIMRGMAAQLTDEQAIKDVVAYIVSLRDVQAAK